MTYCKLLILCVSLSHSAVFLLVKIELLHLISIAGLRVTPHGVDGERGYLEIFKVVPFAILIIFKFEFT
jgi:hypothetical protein